VSDSARFNAEIVAATLSVEELRIAIDKITRSLEKPATGPDGNARSRSKASTRRKVFRAALAEREK